MPNDLQFNNNYQVVNPNDPSSSISVTVPPKITTSEDEAKYTISGANPLLFNAPIYIANSVDDKAKTSNPNERLQKLSTTPKTEKNKNEVSELEEGGVKSHTITSKEIKDLEVQTNLTLYPYLFSGELARIRHQFSNLNKNKYYLLLNMLVYGFDNKILQSGVYGHDKYVIDEEFLNDFLRMAKIPQLQEIIKKTPAYAKGSFNEIGKLGVTQANANNMFSNIITGPLTEIPRTIEALIDKIHPNSVSSMNAFCNRVRTNAYLTLPKRAFGALVGLVTAINGVLTAFAQIITDIYNGIIAYIQQIFGLINALITKIQQLIMGFLESIIPVDILCILLLILDSMLTDVPFYSSLMNMSNLAYELESNFKDYVEETFKFNIDGFADDPLREVSKFLPPEVNKVIKAVNSLVDNPNSYLSGMLMDFGYGLAAKQTQSALYERILDEMGPTFTDMNVMGSILGVGRDPSRTRPEPVDILGALFTKNGKEDAYGHVIRSAEIKSNVA